MCVISLPNLYFKSTFLMAFICYLIQIEPYLSNENYDQGRKYICQQLHTFESCWWKEISTTKFNSQHYCYSTIFLMYMYVHIDKIVSVCQWRHVSLQPMVCQWRKVGLDIYPGIISPNKWDSPQAGRSETGCCFDEFDLIMRFYQNRLKKKLWISLSSWSTISVLVKCTIYEHFGFFFYIYRLWINIFLKLPTGLMKLPYISWFAFSG